jgi:hypothetical protein
MPFRFSEASDDLKAAAQTVEHRADQCYKLLRLLNRPANIARWGLLTAMAYQLETWQQKYGANTPEHNVRMVTLDRCTCGFKFISEHGKQASRLVDKFTWSGSLIDDANHALFVTEQYTHFLSTFPLWHKNHEQVDVLADGRVRFYIPRDSPGQRRVIAFQQRYYPRGHELATQYSSSIKESPEAKRLLNELWNTARPTGTAKKFRYEPSWELIEALRPQYEARLDDNFRRPDTFQLHGYSLGEFKSFYIALLILCAIHEYVCYPFDKSGQPIPASSLVMVKTKAQWLTQLSQISALPGTTCEDIISDLTLNPVIQPGASMCIHPFVPLDAFALAVAPQFPLASAVDDNILRHFSYTFPTLYSAQNTDKETVMRERITEVAPQYVTAHSIELPDKSAEIDMLLVDEVSSVVAIAELKWSRKPNRTIERIARDEEIAKGVRQLRTIRTYARQNPDFLHARGKLPKSLSDYAHVHYLLVVWDHWYWVEPEDAMAIIHFDALLPALRRSTNLQETLSELLKYEWLPVEGRDFKVKYAAVSANGAVMESSIFSPASIK